MPQVEYSNAIDRHEAPIPEGCPPEFRKRIMEIRASRTGEKRNIRAERTVADARTKAADMKFLNSLSLAEIAHGKNERPFVDKDAVRARLLGAGLFF